MCIFKFTKNKYFTIKMKLLKKKQCRWKQSNMWRGIVTNGSVQALAPKRRAWSGGDELAVVMDGCDWNYMLWNVWRMGLYLWTNFSRKSSAACETNVHIKLPNFLKKRQLFMHMIWNLTWRDIFSLKKKNTWREI